MTEGNEGGADMNKARLLELLDDRDVQKKLCAVILNRLPGQIRVQRSDRESTRQQPQGRSVEREHL